MAGQEKWYFPRDQLQISPSRRCGLDADKELAYRQQAANLIQDMGQRLQVSQLCINTAIVYMHRFYAFHSFTQFHRSAIAAAALFLSAKVEEQPRKLEYVIKISHMCLHRGENIVPLSPEQYQEQAQDLVFNENVLLQTLGFDVAIDHPHTHVVRTCHLIKAPKDLAQTSYFMASNSLHLTTMCLQYRPTVVACFCIHLASKWSSWAIPQSNEGRPWFSYVDRSVTTELLEQLTSEFLHIFDKCPSRLKRKMMTMSNNSGSPHQGGGGQPPPSNSANSIPFKSKSSSSAPPPPPCDDFDKSFDREYEREKRRPQAPGGYIPAPTAAPAAPPATTTQKIDYNVYREKREREERERRQQQQMQQQPRPGSSAAPAPRPAQQPLAHHPPRPATSHHHKPHHTWPHHKAPHHKPPQDHRHRPQPNPPHQTPAAATPQPQEPPRTRPPSLFSPDNATTPTAAAAAAPRRSQPPPQQPPRRSALPQQAPPVQEPPTTQHQNNRPQSPHKKRPTEAATAVRDMQPPAILSPFTSPVSKEQPKPKQRTHSSSDPELVPVVKKLDESSSGVANAIRDSQRAAAMKTKQPEHRRPPEPPPTRALNGIETDPTLVSNLLKESLAKPVPITVPVERKSPLVEKEVKRELPVVAPPPPLAVVPQPEPATKPPPAEENGGEHRHKKDKKKKEKHKHKDRDKSKEERKKHKKDKDRERKKESTAPVPLHAPQSAQDSLDAPALKITIPRDKISLSPGLKIKIPKERLAVPPPPPPPSSLKIKISKEVLDTSRKRTGPPNHHSTPAKLPRHNGAPHPHKVGNWHNIPPPYHVPYYVMQPPPPFYMGMGMQDYFYGMYPPMQAPAPALPTHAPAPPLPTLPPPPLPPPPPE